MYARGQAMGAEHAGKGIDVQLGPVAGPIGRVPEGGRNVSAMVHFHLALPHGSFRNNYLCAASRPQRICLLMH